MSVYDCGNEKHFSSRLKVDSEFAVTMLVGNISWQSVSDVWSCESQFCNYPTQAVADACYRMIIGIHDCVFVSAL